MEKRKVDIIIPVHNRWEHTKQTLDSLRKNTDPSLYRLYIVDDASDADVAFNLDKYMEKFAEETYGKNHHWELHKNHVNIGPAAIRNTTCGYITRKMQRSEFLYHSDNDVFFTPGWLEKLITVYESVDPLGVKVLGGGCHPYLQTSSILYEGIFGSGWQYRVGKKDAVSGYSQLMSWKTWDTYGPFDEGNRTQEIKIMGSEDWAFCQRIIKDGFKVGSIEPEVVIATGKTNTYGRPATGSETFKNIDGIMIQ